MQYAESVFIGYKGDLRSVVGELKLVHIPGDIRGQVGVLARGQVYVGEPLKLEILIGSDIYSFTVLAELTTRIRDLHRAAFRGQQGFRPVVGIDDPEVAFIGRDFLERQHSTSIRGPVERFPSTSLQLRQHVI